MLDAIVCFDAFRCNKRVHDQRGQWRVRVKGNAFWPVWKGTKHTASKERPGFLILISFLVLMSLGGGESLIDQYSLDVSPFVSVSI